MVEMLLIGAALLFAGTPTIEGEAQELTALEVCLEEAAAAPEETGAPIPSALAENLANQGSVKKYVECAAEAGEVTGVTVLGGESGIATLKDGTTIEFTLEKSVAAWQIAQWSESGITVSAVDDITFPEPEAENTSKAGTSIWAAVIAVSLIVLFVGGLVWSYVARRKKGMVPGVVGGENKAAKRLKEKEIPETRFSDVAGSAEAVYDLQEMVEVLKKPERYKAIGARAPKGALLIGPPGTGKTLLARAVAGEAGVPFFSAAGSDFTEKFVGLGAKRVRELFEQARKAKEGAIVFIDEIDAIGQKRTSDSEAHSGTREFDGTLIALLAELDGFKESNIIVIGATNRAEVLDPALTRPGRLDRKIQVGLPTLEERLEVLKVHSRDKPLEGDVNLVEIAERTPGMSGAQLEQICNEAALNAVRENRTTVTGRDLHEAVEHVMVGRARKSVRVHDADRKVTAWHEAGHTAAALCLEHAADPAGVSITPRGPAGGITWMVGSDRAIVTRQELEAQLTVALAGRAAEEELLGGEFTAGASGDLQQATQIARAMVETLGMTKAGLGTEHSNRQKVEDTIEELLQEAHQKAQNLIRQELNLVTAIAEKLLQQEDLGSSELQELAKRHRH